MPLIPITPEEPRSGGSISCTQAIDLMGAYLAHEMTFWQRSSFVDHIRGCPDCHDKLLLLEIHLHLAAEDDNELQR
jgi:hypothetical protein